AGIRETLAREGVGVAEDSFRRYRELPAFTCMGRTLTYAEVDALSGAFAAFLQQRGLRRGDRVALMMPNVLQYPICLLGTLRAGGVVVNVNPLYTPRELRDQLADAAPRVLVVMETSAHVYEQVEREVAVPEVVVTRFGDMLGWRGPLVDFAVRRLKKLVAPWSLPQASDFRAVIA